MALRRIEFEGGRLLQAQILFLKGQDLAPFRDAVSVALERRHTDVRKLWQQTLCMRRHRRTAMRMMRSVDADQRSGLTRRSKSISLPSSI